MITTPSSKPGGFTPDTQRQLQATHVGDYFRNLEVLEVGYGWDTYKVPAYHGSTTSSVVGKWGTKVVQTSDRTQPWRTRSMTSGYWTDPPSNYDINQLIQGGRLFGGNTLDPYRQRHMTTEENAYLLGQLRCNACGRRSHTFFRHADVLKDPTVGRVCWNPACVLAREQMDDEEANNTRHRNAFQLQQLLDTSCRLEITQGMHTPSAFPPSSPLRHQRPPPTLQSLEYTASTGPHHNSSHNNWTL